MQFQRESPHQDILAIGDIALPNRRQFLRIGSSLGAAAALWTSGCNTALEPAVETAPERDYKLPPEVREFINDHFHLSHPPISKYKVSLAGEMRGRPLIPGVNIEFTGTTLTETIHGEHSLVAIAHALEYERLDTIYFDSGAPCGMCRQTMNELASDPLLWIDGQEPHHLSYYLPSSFGPKDLGMQGGLLNAPPQRLVLKDSPVVADQAIELALKFASRSYAPYTQEYAGVVLRLKNGKLAGGSYLENAAYNPTLSPFHSAVACLVGLEKAPFDSIDEVTLVTVPNQKVNHIEPIERLLRSMKVECPVRMLLAAAV